jgi:glycine cleavage system aminomethyltransferase T
MGNRVLVNRMNRTQAAVWHLNPSEPPKPPAETAYTDVTEATVFLALFGPDVFSIVEKLTALDLCRPEPGPPFLVQGPFSRVPCQIVVLERNGETDGGLLFTCSRGYTADMVASVLSAGREFGLRPAGEKAFVRWIATVFPENGTT